MSIFIKQIVLENFKSFEKIEFNCNSNFNVIIGENNVGKTSFFDAILIWKLVYHNYIKKDLKGFFQSTSKPISFDRLKVFRIININDLFLNSKKPLSICLTVSIDGKEFGLGFEIDSPKEEEYAYIRTKHNKYLPNYNDFANAVKNSSNKINLKDIVSVGFTKPISFIDREECFYNSALIQKKSYLGRGYETLRNKILSTQVDKKFSYLEEKLTNILNQSVELIYKNQNKDDEEYIKLHIKIGNNKEIDIALLGSGLLHIMEIFASLHVRSKNESGLNILLIDEPDSHIHTDLQIKVIKELKKDKYRQIFIISHNDRMISQANSEELFYLDKISKESKKLNTVNVTDFLEVKKALTGELVEVNELSNEIPILFVEGDSDRDILKKAISVYELDKNIDILGKIRIEPAHCANGVKDKVLAWHFIRKQNKAVALFDGDKAGVSAIKEVNDIVLDKSNNIKLMKLSDYKPQHIISIFNKKINIPISIEEILPIDVWRHFASQNWLEDKIEILSLNKFKNGISQSFENYCKNDKGLTDDELLYLKKVRFVKKEKASKYICSLDESYFKPFEKVIEKICKEFGLDTRADIESAFTKNTTPSV